MIEGLLFRGMLPFQIIEEKMQFLFDRINNTQTREWTMKCHQPTTGKDNETKAILGKLIKDANMFHNVFSEDKSDDNNDCSHSIIVMK